MFCHICGNELNEQAIVCPKCGCMVQNKKEMQNSSSKANGLISLIMGSISLIIAIFTIIEACGEYALNFMTNSLLTTSIIGFCFGIKELVINKDTKSLLGVIFSSISFISSLITFIIVYFVYIY